MKTSNSQHRIKLLAIKLGITQKEMAIKADIRPEAISRYVKGVCEPGQNTISKLADTYNINPAWLMGYGNDSDIE